MIHNSLQLGASILVFIMSLPLAVMLGAAVLGFRDVQDWQPNVVRLLVCATAVMTLLLLFGLQYWPIMLGAAATITCLHLFTYWGLRWWVKRRPNTSNYVD